MRDITESEYVKSWGLKVKLTLDEIEYCFSNDYSRDKSVIGNEYDSLKQFLDWAYKCSLEELINYYGEGFIIDYLESVEIPFKLSDEEYNMYKSYIETCTTATDKDKKEAMIMIQLLLKN